MGKPTKYFSFEKSGKSVDIEIYGDVVSFPWIESDVSSYGLAQQIKGLEDVDSITVGINSYGGEVKEGLAIYNALKNSPAKVTTRCDGFACSAASIIFCAGDERVMRDASLLMIHNAWASAEGDANELRKQADILEKVTEPSIRAYMSVCNLEEDELRALMDSETWIDPDEALDMGFATSVVKEKSDKASQSVRKKVLQMIKNPYQLEDPENPDEEPETDEDPATGAETTGETGEEEPDGSGEEPETTGEDVPENPEEDPEDEEEQRLAQFLTTIFK